MKVVETWSGITTARVSGSIRPIAWTARLRRVTSGAASLRLSDGPCGALGCDIWRISADGDGRVPRRVSPGKPRAHAAWRRTTMTAATQVPGGSPLPRWLRLAAVILPVAATAAIGSAATQAEIPGWYASLNKPDFNPPNWVFPVAWT